MPSSHSLCIVYLYPVAFKYQSDTEHMADYTSQLQFRLLEYNLTQ